MKALKARKHYDQEQEQAKWEAWKLEKQAKLDAMSEEERDAYLQEQNEMLKAIGFPWEYLALFSQPYTTLLKRRAGGKDVKR